MQTLNRCYIRERRPIHPYRAQCSAPSLYRSFQPWQSLRLLSRADDLDAPHLYNDWVFVDRGCSDSFRRRNRGFEALHAGCGCLFHVIRKQAQSQLRHRRQMQPVESSVMQPSLGIVLLDCSPENGPGRSRNSTAQFRGGGQHPAEFFILRLSGPLAQIADSNGFHAVRLTFHTCDNRSLLNLIANATSTALTDAGFASRHKQMAYHSETTAESPSPKII